MRSTYVSRTYAPERVAKRYVRADRSGEYFWCETTGVASWYDLRQGWADATEIPEDIRKEADARLGYYPGFVDWPLTQMETA